MTEAASETRTVPPTWHCWIRQIHRWLSIAFTAAVVVTFFAMAQADPVVWVAYVPLLPLGLLLLTGLYMFVLPYAGRRLGGRSGGSA